MEVINTEEGEREYYLGAKVCGSVFKYAGLVSGIASGASVLQDGWDLQKAGLMAAGVVLYSLGDIWQHLSDRSNLIDELNRRGLEDKVAKK